MLIQAHGFPRAHSDLFKCRLLILVDSIGEKKFPLPSKVLLAGLRIKLTCDRLTGEKAKFNYVHNRKPSTWVPETVRDNEVYMSS